MHHPLSHWPTKPGMLGNLVDLDQLRSATSYPPTFQGAYGKRAVHARLKPMT